MLFCTPRRALAVMFSCSRRLLRPPSVSAAIWRPDVLQRSLNTASSSTSPPANSSPQSLLAYYSQWPTKTVQLQDLKMHGAPPLDEPTLLESAERTRKELLAGLARRVSPLVCDIVESATTEVAEQPGGMSRSHNTSRFLSSPQQIHHSPRCTTCTAQHSSI